MSETDKIQLTSLHPDLWPAPLLLKLHCLSWNDFSINNKQKTGVSPLNIHLEYSVIRWYLPVWHMLNVMIIYNQKSEQCNFSIECVVDLRFFLLFFLCYLYTYIHTIWTQLQRNINRICMQHTTCSMYQRDTEKLKLFRVYKEVHIYIGSYNLVWMHISLKQNKSQMLSK